MSGGVSRPVLVACSVRRFHCSPSSQAGHSVVLTGGQSNCNNTLGLAGNGHLSARPALAQFRGDRVSGFQIGRAVVPMRDRLDVTGRGFAAKHDDRFDPR